jgi:adenylate cyclase
MQPTRSATVREFAAKLRITAAVLGCASQKDLCAQFHRVNPGTTFDLDRSYKWMQGRALPRSAKLYDDWALVLGTERPPAYLQSCTLDEFLDLACDRFGLSRETLVARAGLDVAPRPEMAEQRHASTGHHGTPPIVAPHVATEKPAIAVLPFTNMSGDPEQNYFSDGISEDLIIDLSKVSGLFVLARNSTFAYKGTLVDVRELSRKLNVRYVLEGSVRKAGAQVRITAQLIDGENGGHVWAERFDRELTDIFAVQDEITQNIVDALKVRLLPAERRALAGQPTANIEAYQHYLRGRQFFHRHDKRSYAIARRLFERACEIDPLFARAQAATADCDAFLYLHSVSGVSPAAILATSARAIELQPDLPEAHASRGLALYVHGRVAEAEHEFETALRLDPNLFETWYFYGRAKFVEGKMAEAAKLFERAAEIHPDDFQAKSMLANIYRSLDRPADSRAAATETLRGALRELERHPDNTRAAYLCGIMLAVLGESERAREWLSLALAIEPDDFLTVYNVACGHAQLGDLDSAIELLERALPSALEDTKAWLRHDRDLDPLREHPRFVALLRRIEAQA